MSDKPNSSMTGRHWWCQTNRRNRFSRKTGWHRPCLTNMKINSPWWHWCQTDNGHSWVCRSSTLVVSTLEIDTVKTRQAYSVISHCSIKIQLFKHLHLQWLRYYRASCRLETLVVGVGYNYGWYVKSHGSFLFRAVGSPGSIFVPFLFVSDKNWGAGQNTLLGERSRASESVVESVRFILGSGSRASRPIQADIDNDIPRYTVVECPSSWAEFCSSEWIGLLRMRVVQLLKVHSICISSQKKFMHALSGNWPLRMHDS